MSSVDLNSLSQASTLLKLQIFLIPPNPHNFYLSNCLIDYIRHLFPQNLQKYLEIPKNPKYLKIFLIFPFIILKKYSLVLY